MTPRRLAWLALGLAALGVGALGVIVPLLPTTPFVLVAAFAFSRSSERWHRWLLAHQVFGPLIENWRAYRAISRRAKAAALLAMAAVLAISLILRAPPLILAVQALVLVGAGGFILSRPTPPRR